MTTRNQLWLAAVVGCLAALLLAALLWPASFRLSALSDVIQCLLLTSGTVCLLLRAVQSSGRIRLFWSLMALGLASWLFYQLLWTYFEAVLRRDVPDIFSGDIVLFLHIVPMMAAVALRPHLSHDNSATRLGRLDFALLSVWWLYLYVLIVIPWQYVVSDVDAYSHNLNAVYLAEKAALLSVLAASWATSRNEWRSLYANLFAASLIYAISSYIANWAITRNLYYSGSLYDVPLCISMAWVTKIGLLSAAGEPKNQLTQPATSYGMWVARGGMIATFSLPLFAVWALSEAAVPQRVRLFRLILTLGTALAMGALVFVRQRLLDRELVHLLEVSQDSFDHLKQLQAQLLQSEKLASIGQLVGGAAHELNNPITAMLGYSDLLLSTNLSREQHDLAAKIGQNVRRTKSLVASLLSYASQAPAIRSRVDLNALARTAVRLAQAQWQAQKIEVKIELDANLPRIAGDSNQLLQVCLQIMANVLHAMDACGGRVLRIGTERRGGAVVLKVSGDPPLQASALDQDRQGEPGALLGLSACQGIVEKYLGRIYSEVSESGRITVEAELPMISVAPEITKLAQSRSSA